MTDGPGRGLPLRTYLPIVVLAGLTFLGVIGYFLKIGLGVTGAALGPVAQQGDANIRATTAPGDAAMPQDGGGSQGEVVVPQSGGGAPGGIAGNGVGGGTPVQAAAAGPPAPVQRLLLDLRQRLQRNPKDIAALASIANLYFDAAKYPQAISYYERALEVDASNPATRTDYAAALHAEGNDRKSLKELEAVLARQPAFPDALFNEGVVARAVGHRAQAVAAFRKFLEVKPNDQRAGDARAALQTLGA